MWERVGARVWEEGPSAPGAIVAIQSHVAYGHVGNSAAVLPLQRLGFDVLAIPTVVLAHHPGYGVWRGFKVERERIEAILDGLCERGLLQRCRALLSGYLGDPAIGNLVLRAIHDLRARDGTALALCDPVIGDDDTGVFVSPGTPEVFSDLLVPAADIVTPNRFELAHLTGRPVVDLEGAIGAADALRARGPRIVLATGLAGMPEAGVMGTLAVAPEGAFLARAPLRERVPHGTGDVLSALFLGHLLRTGNVVPALAAAAQAIDALILRTVTTGAEELAIVASQDDYDPVPDTSMIERLR